MTARELAEWDALLVRKEKGKLDPGDPYWDRYLELAEKKAAEEEEAKGYAVRGGEADPPAEGAQGAGELLVLVPDGEEKEEERKGKVFGSTEEAAEYYGVKRRMLLYWKKIGKEAGDPCPVERPEDMPGWFARMRAAGRRKQRTPERVLERAREVMRPKLVPVPMPEPTVPQVVAEDAMPPAAEVSGAEATADEISSHYRRQVSRCQRLHDEAMARGDMQAAMDAQAQIDTLVDKLRAWERDREKMMRASREYMPRAEVQRTFFEAMSRLWRMLRRELSYDPQSTERMNALHERLEVLLDEVWRTAA